MTKSKQYKYDQHNQEKQNKKTCKIEQKVQSPHKVWKEKKKKNL